MKKTQTTFIHKGQILEFYQQKGKTKAKGTWRFRVTGRNGQKLNDAYMTQAKAVRGFKALLNAMCELEMKLDDL